MKCVLIFILCLILNVSFATNTLTVMPNGSSDMKPHPKYRNIVFDLGNVLIFSTLKYALQDLCSLAGGTVEQKISTERLLLDYNRGVLNEEQFAHQLAYILFPDNWTDMYERTLHVVQENINGLAVSGEALDLLQVLKLKGYKVYILSNLTPVSYEAIHKIPGFFERFDGAVFSYELGCVKPEPEIYEALLTKYSLNPEECCFIDDLEANIEGGKKLGIDGVVYDNHLQAVEELKHLKVL